MSTLRPAPKSPLGAEVFALGLSLVVSACRGPSARELHDTEGRSFHAACTREGSCKLEQVAGVKLADKPQQTLSLRGRLVGLCDLAEGAREPEPGDCRPLRCDTDADCPPAHDLADGQCLNHFCADPARELGQDDAVLLCLAGTGLGRDSAKQVERYALAINCGTPCRVPAPCAQP